MTPTRRMQTAGIFCIVCLISMDSVSSGQAPPVGPRAPTNLTVIAGSASHFNLRWRDNSVDEQGFRIERRLDWSDPWVEVAMVPPNTTKFQSIGLQADTIYEHRVIALSERGDGIGATVSGRTKAASPRPLCRIFEKKTARETEGSFLKAKTGDIHLYYAARETHADKSMCWICVKVSQDDGVTWQDQGVLFQQKQRLADEYPEILDKGWALKHPHAVRLPNGKIGLTYTKNIPGGSWISIRVFRYFPRRGLEGLRETIENIMNASNWSAEYKMTDDTWPYSAGVHDRTYVLSDGSLLTTVLVADKGRLGLKIGTDMYRLPARYVDDPEDDPSCKWVRATPERIYIGGRSGFVESSAVEWDPVGHPGHLLAYGRTETGWFYEVRSKDFGQTWSAPVQSPVRAPVAPPYLRKIPNTPYIVLIWNPYDPCVKGRRRAILASQISRDGGNTWENYKQIEYTGKEAFDYPFVLFDDDSIHLAYRVRNSIGYRKLPRDWFTNPK